jgi:hypothetical protein
VNIRFIRFVCCVFLAVALCSQAETQTGIIKGLVVNEQGKPVGAAHVTWTRAVKGEAEVHIGPVEFVLTDGRGRFLIHGLTVGTPYNVYGQKDEDNYADPSPGFYNPKGETVTAIAADPDKAVDVAIHVGPKAGRLNWNVTDAVTGKPVNPTMEVVRSDTGASLGGGGPAQDTHLLPSDTDLVFSVSAPGYRTWHYSAGDKKHRSPLRLKPGEEKTVNIQLQPVK